MGPILIANALLLLIAYAAFALIVRTHPSMAGGSRLDHVSRAAVGCFYRRSHGALRGFSSPWSDPTAPGNAGAGVLLDRLPGRARLYGGAAGGLLAGFALVRRAMAQFKSAEPRRGPVRGDGSGIAAYLAGPLLLYVDRHPAIDVALMSIAVLALAYLLGRTLDYSDPLPISLAFVPVLLAMPAGIAVLHADTIWLGIAAAVIVTAATAIVAGSAVSRRRRVRAIRAERRRLAQWSGGGRQPYSGRCPSVHSAGRESGLSAVSLLRGGLATGTRLHQRGLLPPGTFRPPRRGQDCHCRSDSPAALARIGKNGLASRRAAWKLFAAHRRTYFLCSLSRSACPAF